MKLLSNDRPFDVWSKATDILYRAVSHTLGPNGANTAVVYGDRIEANAKFNIINDGKSIIDNLTSEEAVVACALQTLKESVLSTNNNAGDGTTSTIVMLHGLVSDLNNYFDVDKDSIRLCSLIKRIKKELLDILPSITEDVSIDDVFNIATTSLGSDEYSSLFDEAFRFVGENGKVLLERTTGDECVVDKLDGVSFDRVGLVAELLLDDIGTINKTVDARSIILDGDISSFSQISKILLAGKTSDVPIVMYFTKMTQEVFQLMLQNIVKSDMKVIPVSLEGYSQEKVRYIKLLESIIGHDAIKISDLVGVQDLSDVNHYIFNSDAMMVRPLDMKKFEEVKDQLRLNISSKTAIIKVGAGNAVLQEELFKRFEDAVYSVSNSLKFGRCLGGGVSYITLADKFAEGADSSVSSWIKNAMRCVYKLLLENCGLFFEDNGIYLLPKFNTETDSWSLSDDLVVYDSYKVIEQVVSNSFDMLYSILSVKAFILDPKR